MTANEINPYIRTAMYSVLRPHVTIKRRVIFDYELIYVESGEFDLMYHAKTYKVTAGDIIFIRPGIPHAFMLGETPVSQPHIHFDLVYLPDSEKVPISFKDIEDFSESERKMIREDIFSKYPKEPFVKINDRDAFTRLFYSAISPSTSALAKKGLLTELIAMLVSDNFGGILERNGIHPVTEQIKNYIDSGQSLTLSLDDFAFLFSYSKFHLDKSFKKAYGMGLIEYRNKKRMEYSKKLLRHRSVSEVAEKVGYRSVYAFSRAYKHYFGASPKNDANGQ